MNISIEEFYKSHKIDENFNEVLYQEQYPETKDFYQPYCKENNIDNKHRLYFHYVNYFNPKLSQQEDKKVIDSYFGQEFLISSKKINYIKNNPIKIEKEQLHMIPNHLECIVLLLSGNELENGYYEHFLNQIEKTVKYINLYFANKLDFKIITNKDKEIKIGILRNLFKSVEVIKSKIPKKYNFYLKEESEIEDHDLRYGLKPRPNYIFFESFEYLTQYNTTLFLECDCFLGEDWLERIYNYTRFSGGFWISGSLYDGITVNEHINGGVGLYATGNHLFLEFLKSCWECFPFFVSQDNNLSYNYYIKQFIDDYYTFSSQKELMKFVDRQYLVNNLIFNYSTDQEKEIAEQIIRKKYNYAILHKKLSKQKEIYEIKVAEDFDSDFYYSEYPIVKEYYLKYCQENNISDRARAYHHYLNFGIDFGLFKNKNEKNNQFDNSILRSFILEG